MSRRLLLLLAALASLMALPAIASATMAYTGTSKNPAGANLPIIVSNNDGTGARVLGIAITGWEPVISPDGRTIAYTSILPGPVWGEELHFVNVRTGAMIDTNTQCSSPVWAPNSSAVACTTTTYTAGGKVRGTTIRTIAPEALPVAITNVWVGTGYSIDGYSWSPDSTKIAWGQSRLSAANATPLLRWRSALGTGGIKKLGAGSNPVWGPTKIAYLRWTTKTIRGQAWRSSTVYTVKPTSILTVRRLSAYKPVGLMNGPVPLYWTSNGKSLVGNLVGEDYIRPMRISTTSGRLSVFGPKNSSVAAISANNQSALVYGNYLGGGQQSAIVTPYAKAQSYVTAIANAGYVSVSSNWNP